MGRSRILCQSCLSDDRKLSFIKGSVLELFLYILGSKLKISPPDCAAMCWECAALLRAVQRFQERARQAQAVLRARHLLNNSRVECLSTLSTTILLEPIDIKNEKPAPTEFSPDGPVEDIKHTHEIEAPDIVPKEENLEIKFKNDVENEINLNETVYSETDLITDDFVAETDDRRSARIEVDEGTSKEDVKNYAENEINLNESVCSETDLITDDFVAETDDRRSARIEVDEGTSKEDVKNEIKPVKKTLKAKITRLPISCYAEVTENPEIDTSNLDKYCRKVCLSEKEMIAESQPGPAVGKQRKPKQYKCKSCTMAFKHHMYLKHHITFNHLSLTTPPYECLQCEASVRSLPELESHWREHCVAYSCSLCGATSRLVNDARRHMSIHAYVYKCRDCEMSFNYKQEFRSHRRRYHKQLICDYCGKSCRSKNSIAKHISRYHQPNVCEYCSRAFATYPPLRKHNAYGCTPERRKQLRALAAARAPALAPEARELAYCVECDKQFPTVRCYRQHLYSATSHRRIEKQKKQKVKCPDCEKEFASAEYMRQHRALQHLGKPQYRCEICDVSHVNASRARHHQKFVHDKAAKPKNKICDICYRGFYTNAILAAHRRTHTGERPFACAHCAAAFAQRPALRAHMRSRHK